MNGEAAKCNKCGAVVSYETGFSMTGGLGDNSQDRLWCLSCAPDSGRGYTLSDLQQMREESRVERAKYEMSVMDRVGPDVYFAVHGTERVRVCNIRPGDVLCDARGDAVGAVTVTAHPSPVDYDKQSEFTLALSDSGTQEFKMLAGVHVWRRKRQ
ncbi:hypothetical protein I5I01_gp34 [Mycobacterium phage MooMoo]|uniref:Uncharacterized protein n=1 Tax=Mycobacterium phage MooMoo TaxID=2108127 RepID=A0A2P1JR81_9CAUD|nr:hypothetical protein I5I01_gp34 [Mycobacterium phage MooMoo]AVO21640.1 hypothetical protein SEA_MOOMOO_34 [Mycobacterium phage MooMoo]